MRKVSCRLIGAACMVVAASTPAMSETLEEVLASTYSSNPTLLARRAKLRSTDEGVPQALSNWRPTVSLTGSVGRGSYDNNTLSPYSMSRTPRTQALTLSQPLFRGGRTLAATAQAENNVLSERAQLAATEQTILLAAATAYLNVVRDDAVLKLSINNEQVLRRQYEATEERFKVGELTRTDVSQAEARLAKATADRVAAEGNLQSSRANYVNNVGRPPEALVTPAQPPALPQSLDDVTSTALAANPTVVSADFTHAAAKDGVDLVFGELLPTVSLSADISRNFETSTRENSSTAREVLLNVSVPLYESGSVYSRVRASKHTAGQRRIEADQARRDAVETGTKSWETLQAARAQARSYQAQIKASELALAGVREESKVGSRTILDVLNAEQELFDARVNLVKAQRDVLAGAYQVKSALGQMTAQGLNLPVAVYDPTKHYDDVRGQWFGNGIDKDKGYE
ncbi:TolC family outer membrane protein [Paramagnetospirillum magneticum]|uniref:Outer membrane protein n=1 Tax=Paramagnetospirillum magneticum (strain ATCC 700264 / AMB-1) TaxID=342108 RepID=Q2W526_PARM1|nr:TolC family outer membrane protein [Paramagnetospirillum magneticum]BAE51049.1 Outer membrane protein [Paramagnetospirillum magneticum AMB-1]